MIWNLHIFQNDHKSKCLLLHIVVKSVFSLFSWLLRFILLITIVSMLYIISPGLKLYNWKLVPFDHLLILNAYTSGNHQSVISSLYKFDGSCFFFKIPHRREVSHSLWLISLSIMFSDPTTLGQMAGYFSPSWLKRIPLYAELTLEWYGIRGMNSHI